MSVHHILNRTFLRLLGKARPQSEDGQDHLARSTSPAAKMNLILRFETDYGPRTIIAPGIPLSLASDVAHEMIRAGHFAEFVDQLPRLSMAERIKRRRAEAAFAKEFGTAEKSAPAHAAAVAPIAEKAEFTPRNPGADAPAPRKARRIACL